MGYAGTWIGIKGKTPAEIQQALGLKPAPVSTQVLQRDRQTRSGAVFVDLETELSDTGVPDAGRHPLPERDDLAALLGRRGIGDDHRVVAYDDSGGAIAARLWWLLRWLGHADVAVLDGGWRAWEVAGLPTTTDVPTHPEVALSPRPPLTKVVDRTTVANRGEHVLYDARATGSSQPVEGGDGLSRFEAPCEVLVVPRNAAQAPPTAAELDAPLTLPEGGDDGVVVSPACVDTPADALRMEEKLTELIAPTPA